MSLLASFLCLLVFLLETARSFRLLFPLSRNSNHKISVQQSMRLYSFNDKELDLLDYLRNEMIRVTELSKDVYASDRDLYIERSQNLDTLFRSVSVIQEMEKDIVICSAQKESTNKVLAAKAASYEREFIRCRAELEDLVRNTLKREATNMTIKEE